MGEDTHESSDVDRAVSLSDESTVPMTRLGMAGPANSPYGLDPEDEPLEPLKVSADSGGDPEKRIDDCTFDIRNMWKRLDLALRKQEKTDSIRRGQIGSISARIYEAERNMSQVEERQENALEKASATFQKQNTNLVRVVGQVNMNFEQLSAEIDRQSTRLRAVEAATEQLPMVIFEHQNALTSMESLKESFNHTQAESMESFRQGLLALEQSLAQHQRQFDGRLQKLEQQMVLAQQQCSKLKSSLEPMQDTLVRLAKQQNERLQGMEEQLAAMREWTRSTQAQHHELARSLTSVVQEVAESREREAQAIHQASREVVPISPVEPFPRLGSDQQFWRDHVRDAERRQSQANAVSLEAPTGVEPSLCTPPLPRRLARDLIEDMASRHRNARDADDEQDLRASPHAQSTNGPVGNPWPRWRDGERNDWHSRAPDGPVRHPEASAVPPPTMSQTGVFYGL